MTFSPIEPLEARIAPATLTLSNPTPVVEGNSSTTNVTFTATLSSLLPNDITVNFATANGTAVAGSDYVAKTQTTTFGKTSMTATFTVQVIGDTVFEATESFFVNLTGDLTGIQYTNANPVDPAAKLTAKATILNDDKNQLSPNSVQWVDVDGDLVTLTSSKGPLLLGSNALKFVSAGQVGGSVLQTLDLYQSGAAGKTYAGTNITVTATKQPGFTGTTDGRVDIGYIKAAEFNTSELQVVGVDLGRVTIDGDLGRIQAGDEFSTPAIAKLDVYSLGARGTATQDSTDASTESKVIGPITAVTVHSNLQGFLHVIGEEFGNIGTLTIGGVLQGSAVANSGVISVSGHVTKATIGSIAGGAADNSGLLLASALDGRASLGAIKVLGDVTGGAGADSGSIQGPRIGSVTIGGKLQGGDGTQSGYVSSATTLNAVTVTGGIVGGSVSQAGSVLAGTKLGTGTIGADVTGGVGDDSGEVAANTSIGAVTIAGKLQGAAGQNSGSVRSGGGILSLKIADAMIGSSGTSSGSVQALGGNIGAVTFGKTAANSILGGSGANSGFLDATGNITSVLTTGTVQGGSANGSGGISAGGTIGKIVIGDSLLGGTPTDSTKYLDQSGFIIANLLTSVSITHDITAGQNLGSGISDSGSIRANLLGSLTVGGNVTGQSSSSNNYSPVVIAARGEPTNLAIKNVKIAGNVTYAEILAGYSDVPTATNYRGLAINADAAIGTVEVDGIVRGLNIVAGAQATVPAGSPDGTVGRFGTANDAVISGSSVRDDPTIFSRISSIIFKSASPFASNPAAYGIVAQQIDSIKVGPTGTSVSLHAGPTNDLGLIELGTNTDFFVHEIPRT